MFPEDGFGDGDFSSMMDNPIFARYFDVISRSMGPDKARAFMRKFGRRFKGMDRGMRATGKRTATSRVKGPKMTGISKNAGITETTGITPEGVPTNEAIRKDVDKRVKKATK
jgi:hypothetical protein